jgi:hypothetical protein
MVIGMLLIFAGVVNLVPWRKILEHYIANNPLKALVYIEIGDAENCETECVHGQFVYSNEQGAFYAYTWRGGELVISVKSGYGYKWLHGRRCLRLASPGDAWASPWTKATIPEGVQKSGYDLNAIYKGHVGVELVKSIYSNKKGISWFMILVIIVGLGIGYYFYQQQQKAVVPPVKTPAPVVPAPKQAPDGKTPVVYDLLSGKLWG